MLFQLNAALLVLLATLTVQAGGRAPAFEAADYLWLCRYNVGPTGELTENKLKNCMNYSRKLMLAQDEINARLKTGRVICSKCADARGEQ